MSHKLGSQSQLIAPLLFRPIERDHSVDRAARIFEQLYSVSPLGADAAPLTQ